MSASPSHADAAPAVAAAAKTHSRAGDFVSLTKPRLNFLVLLTTAAAYSLGAAPDATIVDLAHTLAGTFLVAGGAAALNQVWERSTDRLMRRTKSRPMAAMRMTAANAPGSHRNDASPALTAAFRQPLSGVALFTTAIPLLYTPMKRGPRSKDCRALRERCRR